MAKEKELELLEGETLEGRVSVVEPKYVIMAYPYHLFVTNKRLVLRQRTGLIKPKVRMDDIVLEYGAIEAAKKHLFLLPYRLFSSNVLYFGIYLKDGTKRNLGITKSLKDMFLDEVASISSIAADDEANAHDRAGNMKQKELWKQESKARIKEAAARGDTRSRLLALINRHLG
jgi:hypothetical protein